MGVSKTYNVFPGKGKNYVLSEHGRKKKKQPTQGRMLSLGSGNILGGGGVDLSLL